MNRKWDSLSPDALYGDAAARVLCRLYKIEPGGRTLQECLDKKFVAPSSKEALRNAIEGDAAGLPVECKASTRSNSANVCIKDFELQNSKAKVLLAWAPETQEICWVATMDDARANKIWLEEQSCWLIPRDKITPL
jgi:hypothetical protein